MITTTYEELELPNDPDIRAKVQVWLDRHDGIAAYENQDLGHPDLGCRVFVSYGSPEAQIAKDDPPTRLPDGLFRDFTGGINWRYTLVGIYRPTLLEAA